MDRAPILDGHVEKWERRYRLPPLVELDDAKPIADVYAAWNEEWLAVAFDVLKPTGVVQCDAKEWWKLDGLRVCVNTRDTPDIKRGTRFCHFFYLLPIGGGPSGKQPIAGVHRMSRAKEHPPAADATTIRHAARVRKGGYSMEAILPASCLNGWDPLEHSRIGLFYKVKDRALPSQHLTATDELGWNVDPSTWATAILARNDA
ncbi:MAG: hypothetical protein U1D55_03355 [Phycisphaerae bacterium]